MGLCRFYELEIACRGRPDAITGYLVDIKRIDQAVRSAAAPILRRVCAETPQAEPSRVLGEVAIAVGSALEGLAPRIRWSLTPYHSFEMASNDTQSVLIRERFDFSASHRLHSPSLSDDENRAVFGKCNNTNGHGHNYQVEPCVEVDLAQADEAPFGLAALERLTDEIIIDAFDHRHLNLDTDAFDDATLPSVENIARVFYERLDPAVRSASSAARLRSITVWETDRTSCTYPAGSA
ncbi:MAG: 6-carboxytetrahydropterin synthase [Planctomycetota bacterium]